MQDPRLSKTQIHNHDSQAQSAKQPNSHTQDPRANHVEFQLYSTGIVHHPNQFSPASQAAALCH